MTAVRKIRDDPVTVLAASQVSERALLVALRDTIAGQIDAGVHPRDLATLSKRLMDLTRELAVLEAAEDGDRLGVAAGTPDRPWAG